VSDYSHTEKGSRTDVEGDMTEDPGGNRKASSDVRAGAGDHQGDRAGNRPFSAEDARRILPLEESY